MMTSFRCLVVVLLFVAGARSHTMHRMVFPASLERHLRSSGEGNVGDRRCATGENCRLLQSCKSLFLLLEAMNLDSVTILREAQCGFMGAHPKVCCPINDHTPATTTYPPHPAHNRDEDVDPSTVFPRPSLPPGVPHSGENGFPDGNVSTSGSPFPRPVPTTPHGGGAGAGEAGIRPRPPFPPMEEFGGGGRPAPPLPSPLPTQPPTSTSRPGTTTLRTTSTISTGISQPGCGAVPPSRILETDIPEFGFYSWVVTLRFTVANAGEKSKSRLECGGSLITKRHVLTAAHCFEESASRHRELSEIVIGDHNLTSTPDCVFLQNGQHVCAEKELRRTGRSVVIHPNYIPKTRANDIAIVTLNADVPFKISSMPVCLPAPNQDITTFLRERRIQTSGWGLNTGNSRPYIEKHQISLQYEDPSVCSQYYNVNLSQGQLCFSSRDIDKYKIKCTKDSGGPLFTNFDVFGPPFTQVGIVSASARGMKCLLANDKGPTIATDVSYYLPWIYEHITA